MAIVTLLFIYILLVGRAFKKGFNEFLNDPVSKSRIQCIGMLMFVIDDRNAIEDGFREMKIREFADNNGEAVYNIFKLKIMLGKYYSQYNSLPETLEELDAKSKEFNEPDDSGDEHCSEDFKIAEDSGPIFEFNLFEKPYYYNNIVDNWIVAGPPMDEESVSKIDKLIKEKFIKKSKIIMGGDNFLIIFEVRKISSDSRCCE